MTTQDTFRTIRCASSGGGKETYIIVFTENTGLNGCDGCAFYNPKADDASLRVNCHSGLPSCKSQFRHDHRNVIFKKKGGKQ